MNTFSVTDSHRTPEPYFAPAAAAGGLGLSQNQTLPPVCIQAKGVASAPAGWQQVLRKRSAPLPDVRTCTRAKRFVCRHESCGRAFTGSDILTVHWRTAHSGEKPFFCPRQGCGYACAASSDMKRHLRVHSGEKPFVCPWEGCGYAAAASGNMKRHLRVHSGEKPFACPRQGCGYASALSGDLKKHRGIHSGEKPFVCPWENCGYACGRADLLTRHAFLHAGEKPFECPWQGCGYTTTASGDLKKHERVHSGEKPFVCPRQDCGQAFKQSNDLTRHVRCHSGEKSFVCPWENCGYASVRSGTLTRHLRVHSREKPSAGSHAGGGPASGRPGALARQVRRCATAGSFVRLGTGRTSGCHSSGASSGHSLVRAHCFQNLEADKPLPVTTQYSPSTVATAAVARLDAQASLYPEVGVERQSTGVSSDSPCSSAPVSSGVCEFFDQGLDPSDRHKLQSPGLNLSPAPPSSAAQLEWEQSPSATAGISDWLTWSADDNLFGGCLPLFRSNASDLEVASSLFIDDDKDFWQALISPAHGEQ